MARVSIVVAVYNHERYLTKAIESVLAQTYKDWELLLWDDGSHDGSPTVARNYAEQYPQKIKFFQHPDAANHGQENTRNAALAVASGEYIALLDSDDWYEPNKLECLVAALEDTKVGLAYGRVRVWDEFSQILRESPVHTAPSGEVFSKLIYENFISAGATLFRKSFFEKGFGFDASFKTIGEYPLWLQIANVSKIQFVDIPVSVWRDHGENTGTKNALLAKAELVALCERMLDEVAYGSHKQSIQRALAKKRYDYANMLFAAGEIQLAKAQCRLALVEKRAPGKLRAKATALLATLSVLSAMGPRAAKSVSEFKHMVWKKRRS